MSDYDKQIEEWTTSAKEWDDLARSYARSMKLSFVWGPFLLCYSAVSVALQQTIVTLIWAVLVLLVGANSIRTALRDRISRDYCQKNATIDRAEVERTQEHVKAMAALDAKFITDMATITATMEKDRANPTTH